MRADLVRLVSALPPLRAGTTPEMLSFFALTLKDAHLLDLLMNQICDVSRGIRDLCQLHHSFLRPLY